MQTLSGALCLEAHQLRTSTQIKNHFLILGYISLHYFGASYLVLTLFRLSTENMCMLNGKTSFPIPNVPVDHKLVRFNVLFAYVFDAVSGGKGMLNLKIDPSKQQTISNLLHETFPAIKCYDNEKLHVINPKTVAYIHALVIKCITIPFEASINSRAH